MHRAWRMAFKLGVIGTLSSMMDGLKVGVRRQGNTYWKAFVLLYEVDNSDKYI